MDPYAILRRPVNTEKGHEFVESNNTYVFEVADEATKLDIRAAVEAIWGVKVVDVRTSNVKGKPKRYRYKMGHTRTWKKALVRVAANQAIDALK